jgi:hypothetical protein
MQFVEELNIGKHADAVCGAVGLDRRVANVSIERTQDLGLPSHGGRDDGVIDRVVCHNNVPADDRVDDQRSCLQAVDVRIDSLVAEPVNPAQTLLPKNPRQFREYEWRCDENVRRRKQAP